MLIDRTQLQPYSASDGSEPPQLVGTWINELGSKMIVNNQDPDGSFTGQYSSAVSGQGPAVGGPLSGYLSGDSIVFVVTWDGYPSATAWSGLVLTMPSGDPVIYALWHLAVTPQSDANWWEAINAGADLFYWTPLQPSDG